MQSVENLITDNLDIWTSAIKTNAGVGRGSSKKRELYGIKKLRELILELAMRGLLVPQDLRDEPASALLKKIAAERAHLEKNGKIKKPKALLAIAEDDVPFKLPDGWGWARFGNVYWLEYGDNLPKAKRSETGEHPVYGSNGVVGTHDDFCIENPCIVVGRKGSAGALNFCFDECCWVTDVAYSLVPPACMSIEFVFQQLHTLDLDSLGKGIKPGLNRNEAYVLPIALPPAEEQKRIVAKVDELMALCDQLEQQTEASLTAHQTLVATLLGTLTNAESSEAFNQAWQRIAEYFDTLFTTEHSIDQLKQTILQLAVMGKLVPQDPNDEPASKLLGRVAEEKMQLVKSKKIKKPKELPTIEKQKKHFELPAGWAWASLSHLGIFSGGKTPSKGKSIYWGGNIPWVTPKDMKVPEILGAIDNVTDTAVEDGLVVHEPGSILFVARSGILRHSLPVAITGVPCTVNQDLKVLRPYLNELSQYIRLMAQGFEGHILQNLTKKGMTVESIVFDKFSTHYFIIPPLPEQHRIIAKVNELETLCNKAKARLIDSQATQIQLANAITTNYGN